MTPCKSPYESHKGKFDCMWELSGMGHFVNTLVYKKRKLDTDHLPFIIAYDTLYLSFEFRVSEFRVFVY